MGVGPTCPVHVETLVIRLDCVYAEVWIFGYSFVVLIQWAVLTLLIYVPSISLWLPRLLFK